MTGASIKTNIYDKLLVILIVSLVSGYAGGMLFSPVHIVEIAVLPYLFSCKMLFRKRIFFQLFLFSFIWLSFSVISLFWASEPYRSIATLVMFFFRFLMCFELLAFSMRARKPLESISKGWLVAVLITLVIGLFEIVTDHHLAMAREAELTALSEIVQRARASVLFYNPNTYSLFLVMAFPFLVYRLFSDNRKWVTIVTMLVLLFVVIRNASRGSILSLGVMTIVTLFYFLKRRKYRRYAILSIVLLVILLAFFGQSLFSAFLLRMETQGMQDGARFDIWAGAWDVFVKSHGLGVGVGSMTAVLGSLNRFGIGYAHCMLLEALVEGGVVLASLIVIFLFRLLKSALSEPQREVKLVLLLSMITYPIYFIINSEYLRPAFIWCFFMCLYLFAKHQVLTAPQQQRV